MYNSSLYLLLVAFSIQRGPTSQLWMVLSAKIDVMQVLSGENATNGTNLVCPHNGTPNRLPVSASQIQTVLSYKPDTTMDMLSGENVTDLTLSKLCPCNGFPTRQPVSAFQMQTVPSLNPDIMCMPWGENMIDKPKSLCPCNASLTHGPPVSASQIWTVPSYEPDIMCVPSSENMTDVTQLLGSPSSSTELPVSAS